MSNDESTFTGCAGQKYLLAAIQFDLSAVERILSISRTGPTNAAQEALLDHAVVLLQRSVDSLKFMEGEGL